MSSNSHASAIKCNEVLTFRNYPAAFAVCSTTHLYENATIALQADLVVLARNSEYVATVETIETEYESTAQQIKKLWLDALRQLPNTVLLATQKTITGFKAECTVYEYMSGYAYFYKDGNIREVEILELASGVQFISENSSVWCYVADPDIIAITLESNEPTQVLVLENMNK